MAEQRALNRTRPVIASSAHSAHSSPAVQACGSFDYHVSVHVFDDFETFFVYPIHLEDRLPPVAIPLLPGDSPVTVDLQSVFDRCYDAGPYTREIRYGEDAVIPPLPTDKAAWAVRVLQAESGRPAPG